MEQESRRHHFVPRGLLRPWLVDNPQNQSVLRGYWWDKRTNSVREKNKGVAAFCVQLDLLTLKYHNLGRDALETIFFGDIDDKGLKVRDKMLSTGIASLSGDERCDFARLLLSLGARRPVNVGRMRSEGAETLRAGLDEDPEILAAFREHGITDAPSEYYEKSTGTDLEDHGLLVIQGLIDNPEVGSKLINAQWHVKEISKFDPSLIISDVPLIRTKGYDDPSTVWALPLTPRHAFIAANHQANLQRLVKATPQRYAKKLNVSSASQAERFIFSVDQSHASWIGKYLRS